MTPPQDQVDAVREWHTFGLNNCQISRELNIPRGTLRGWLYPRQPEQQVVAAADARRAARVCQRCNGTESTLSVDYVYLLGLYLGDGCISGHRKRGVVAPDLSRPAISWPDRRVRTRDVGSDAVTRECAAVDRMRRDRGFLETLDSPFPATRRRPKMVASDRHGALAAKIDRRLSGTADPRPDSLGRMSSDKHGERHGACKQRRYSCPRYMFTNMSDSIRFLFVEACERLNVRWMQTNARTIAVSRRDDVARLDTFIGPKY